ncbi:MAG: carbamoyltransferase N-terminal domain-containing protein, partial [Stellaceae bacterium]
MVILGINAFHGDSSAALVRDGVLVAAAEEERFRRIKHWAGFPSQSIAYCLREAGIRLGDVDHVSVNLDGRAHRIRKAGYLLRRRPNIGLVLARLENRQRRQQIPELLAAAFAPDRFCGKLHNVEHHLAHLSSAFYVSPFAEAAVVSVDGFGDFASAAWGIGRGTDIEIAGRVYFPHSLGIFYEALTHYLGFPYYGDEYKVMGLAPYGNPSYLAQMRRIVHLVPDGTFKLDLDYFVHQTEEPLQNWENAAPQTGDLFSSRLEELLGPRRQPDDPLEERHRDIARSVQRMYEEAFFHLIGKLQQHSGLTDIALAGGCAMNSVANGKIRRMTGFRRVYVQSAAGDAGGAIGAAFAVWNKLGGARSFVMDHAFWGPQFDGAVIAEVLAAAAPRIGDAGCVAAKLPEAELCRQTAAAIADGKVVGWFQGRMEWGPRALGNRSI